MAKYTNTVGEYLLSISELNKGMEVTPYWEYLPEEIIDLTVKKFWARIPFDFGAYDDKFENQAFNYFFMREFLDYFYDYEIGYETVGTFMQKLGQFMRLNAPMYGKFIRKLFNEDDMFLTNESGNTSNSQTIGGEEHEDHTATHNTDVNTNQVKSALVDTPQTEIDTDLDPMQGNTLDYATSINVNNAETRDVADGTSNENGKSVNHTGTQTTSGGKGRTADIYDIIDEWVQSGYNVFIDLFDRMIEEDLFLRVH